MALNYKFDELLKFPCHQDMRIIVNNGEDEKLKLMHAINEIVAKEISLQEFKESRPSKNGKYISHTVRIKFASAEEMERLYKKLSECDFVMHVL